MCKKYIFLSLFILSVTAQALINKANAQDLTKAFQYFNTGQYKQAASEFETAILIVEKEYGNKDTSNYSKLLLYTAVCFDRCTNYIKAEQYYLQSIAVYKSVNAVYAPMYATACNNLAELYREAGNFEKAEALYIEAKEIDEKIYGKNHANYGTDCNNLALLYHTTGNYKKAEYLYITAKNVAGKVLGNKHPNYASSCNNLAEFYRDIGNYQKAESLYFEAKKIRKNILGEEHPDYATSCDNLGLFYSDVGYSAETYKERLDAFKKAGPLYIEAKKIREKNPGKQHTEYASSCNNLAVFYEIIGRSSKILKERTDAFQKAESLYIEAREIDRKNYGKEHPFYAGSCNNLAGLYKSMGNFSKYYKERTDLYHKSEQLYIEAKNIRDKIFGKQHPDYVKSCNGLASLYERMSNYKKAEPLYKESNAVLNFLSAESAKFMSEKEREFFLTENINYFFDVYHSFFLKRRKENKQLTGIVYNNALVNKGQLLKSATAIRRAVLQSGDIALINIYNKMNSTGKILAHQYSLPISERRPDIIELEDKVNTLEKELISKSQNFAKVSNFGKVGWNDIKKNLKSNEAAVEFIHFRYRNNKEWTDSILYYALILRKNYKYPKAVFLFEKKQLEVIMKRSVNVSEYNYIKNLYDPKSAKADSLYILVWQPLEQYLDGSKNIYISPSGILNKVSFDAIPYDTANILSDKYKIIYTTSTAEAINKIGLYQKDIKSSVLFGGIEYKIKPEEMEKLALKFNLTKTDRTGFKNLTGMKNIDNLTRNISWTYLPGSLEETEEIQDVLKKKNISVKFYTGKQGSEEQFKALENETPSILHISTHGFYFGDDEKSNEYRDMIDKDIKFAHSDNPLLRSGFILAGGNTAFQSGKIPEGVEDGVLTAAEISRLNFFKTKLVVLSACQTGLGDVKGSEGVYGLQRSFKMAGVDYLLFSLWEVPDETTKELMSNFYKNWFSGMEIRDAFKKAQNHLKTKYADVPGAAFAWAAFVLMK